MDRRRNGQISASPKEPHLIFIKNQHPHADISPYSPLRGRNQYFYIMSTYKKILYQIVFGSKYGHPFLNPKNETTLYNYMAGTIRNKNSVPYIIGGHANHVHIISSLHPSVALADLVKDIKISSNLMMKEEPCLFDSFREWQSGYGAFTYHIDIKNNLLNYVKNQKEHHQQVTFVEELIAYFEEFGIEYDKRYLLD